MKFLISPAKTMKTSNEKDLFKTTPVYLKTATKINKVLKTKSLDELSNIFKSSQKLTIKIKEDIDNFLKNENIVINLLDGLQYKNINYSLFSLAEKAYFNTHVYVMSGLYGILKPTDLISPYRLDFKDNLGEFRSYDLYKNVILENFSDTEIYINLLSSEYSHILENKVSMINIVFCEIINGKIRVKSTFAKIARGQFLQYVTKKNIENIEDLKKFNVGFLYSEQYSNETTFVFIKVEE